jgi:DNA-directed RNA polymerase specialized sigma24 family protein
MMASGESAESFPLTRPSVLVAARSDDARERAHALELIASAYWKPVFTYLRLRWRIDYEDARDYTQEFFSQALLRDLFARFEPGRARFRTYVRLCLDSFVTNARKAERRLKRGGDADMLSLDFPGAEAELVGRSPSDDPEGLFHREWVRSIFSAAVDALRARCERAGKTTHFAIFVRYDIEGPELVRPPSYAELSAAHGIPVTQVTNYLAFCRREFKAIVLESLRAQCATVEEFRDEARALLGVELS